MFFRHLITAPAPAPASTVIPPPKNVSLLLNRSLAVPPRKSITACEDSLSVRLSYARSVHHLRDGYSRHFRTSNDELKQFGAALKLETNLRIMFLFPLLF